MSMHDRFKEKMVEQIRKQQGGVPSSEEQQPVEHFTTEESVAECGKHQKMFSELFFDPATIKRPDFPVDTFFHMHEEWPQWVKDSVPKRDPNYQWNKEITYAFVISDDEHAFLVGYPGSGKTTLPSQVAAITGRPVYKQSFKNDLEQDEWIMSKEIDSEGTKWNELPYIKTLAYPFYAVHDEFNRLRRGGRLLMNRLLDQGGTMQLPDGREITPHEHWRAVATDNTRGLGDGLDMFDGDVSDISTTDRFGIMLEVDYLPRDQQVELVMKWEPGLTKELATDIVMFGEKVVLGFKKGELPLPWTPRRMAKAAKLAYRYRNPVSGLRYAYYEFLAEDSERKACNQILKDIGLNKTYGDFS